jgi:uncharacterized protein YndB with AHSA1/START domain
MGITSGHYTMNHEASIFGRRIDIDGAPALIFQRELEHRPEALWAVLTEPAGLASWLQAEAVIEPAVGGCFCLVFGNGGSVVNGTITQFQPPRLLEYTWPDSAANGDSRIRFDLRPDGPGTLLILTHILTGGSDMAGFGSGWHWHLDQLDAAVDGETRAFNHAAWESLHKVYVTTL